jgi:cytochrome c-type biogenesis protein CcmH/NrfF
MLEDCGAECGGAPEFRKEIQALLEQGKTRDQIVAMFADRFGGMHVLGAPPDRGFNRLAWALPYGLGLAGAGALAYSAWRLSRRKTAAVAASGQAARDQAITKDRDLEDKLEDELSRVDS